MPVLFLGDVSRKPAELSSNFTKNGGKGRAAAGLLTSPLAARIDLPAKKAPFPGR